MTITREHLEKAAKAAGYDLYEDAKLGLCIKLVAGRIAYGKEPWQPHIDKGQLHDLAMACKIDIKPSENRIGYWRNRAYCVEDVNCQDFPALAEAVILAACEQFDAKGGE